MQRQPHFRHIPNRAVILLIPTLEGRDYLAETLESVREYAHCFDRFLLSVNGVSTCKAEEAALEKSFNPGSDVFLFCTGEKLSAIKHLRFILGCLDDHAAADDLIFLLADDDLLPSGIDLSAYIAEVRDCPTPAVGMGRFSAFSSLDTNPSQQSQHIEPGETITPFEFLVRNQHGHLFTNISSMLFPYEVFKEAGLFMWHFGSSGRRCEYILSTHRSVSFLYSPVSCSAFIREHPLQEGRTLSHESYLHDELIYILWVWLNQPATRPWAKGEAIQFFWEFKSTRFKELLLQLLTSKIKRNAPDLHASFKKARLIAARLRARMLAVGPRRPF